MNRTELLHRLIDELQAYEESATTTTDISLEDFAYHLLDSTTKEAPSHKMATPQMARSLAYIFRYMRNYTKKALHDSQLITLEEYTYLISLWHYSALTKSELNQMNVMEKTSGQEVIKRLLSRHLITQEPHPTDARSLNVSITDAGREELTRVKPQLYLSAEILFSAFTNAEKVHFQQLCDKMINFHTQFFHPHRELSLEQLKEEVEELRALRADTDDR